MTQKIAFTDKIWDHISPQSVDMHFLSWNENYDYGQSISQIKMKGVGAQGSCSSGTKQITDNLLTLLLMGNEREEKLRGNNK